MVNNRGDLGLAVWEQLGRGKTRAIPGKLLAQRLGEKDTRAVRLAIIKLIEDGTPVIGDSARGYFIAETPAECRECLDRLMSYLKMIARHHKYLLRASQKLLRPEQIKMRF